jgi:hypothetical protein
MLRLRMARELRRRPNHGHADLAGDRHGDHVLVDHLAGLNAGIEPCRANVEAVLAHEEVEPDVRMLLEKAGEQVADEEAFRRGHDVKAERPARLGTGLA